MSDITQSLASLRRPRLLIHAARFGLKDYQRERDLRRMIGIGESKKNPATLRKTGQEGLVSTLFGLESRIEAERQSGAASYSVTRHIEVLVALLAETRVLAAPKAEI